MQKVEQQERDKQDDDPFSCPGLLWEFIMADRTDGRCVTDHHRTGGTFFFLHRSAGLFTGCIGASGLFRVSWLGVKVEKCNDMNFNAGDPVNLRDGSITFRVLLENQLSLFTKIISYEEEYFIDR